MHATRSASGQVGGMLYHRLTARGRPSVGSWRRGRPQMAPGAWGRRRGGGMCAR